MEMHAITIRHAEPADLPILSALFDDYRQFYGKTSDPAAAEGFLRERFDKADSVLLMAFCEDGSAAGFVQLYPSFSSVSMARIFYLNDLYVRPDARRMGVAQKLLENAVRIGAEQGAVRLSLVTGISNDAAQALYERCGWKKDQQFYAYHYLIPN